MPVTTWKSWRQREETGIKKMKRTKNAIRSESALRTTSHQVAKRACACRPIRPRDVLRSSASHLSNSPTRPRTPRLRTLILSSLNPLVSPRSPAAEDTRIFDPCGLELSKQQHARPCQSPSLGTTYRRSRIQGTFLHSFVCFLLPSFCLKMSALSLFKILFST